MAGQTILDVMPPEDREILMAGVKADQRWAIEFLEICFTRDTENPVLGTKQQEIEMVLESFNAHIQKFANNIVGFSRGYSPEEQAAAVALNASGHSL